MDDKNYRFEVRRRPKIVETQPGSPNFDGAEAYEAFLDSGGYQAYKPAHSNGYAPQPPSPAMPTWNPVLSQQEQEARNKLIESGEIPF